MAITARGAWEAVKRHFREIGTDIQASDFTAIGVGDMSGDVFGNGMLRSAHTKLIAAFDHRHIFLDPDPDPATSFAERQRLFALPRSSWADYNAKLISKGGGIFERSRKSIALSPEIAARLGLTAEKLTPAELAQAILKAPVDLLGFGGIGTYVKSAAQRHAEVGGRANDALRIDAEESRAARGAARTRPELAVLRAYVKNTLVGALGDSDLPATPQLARYLLGYFPPLLVERFPRAIAAHRLRREIIATVVANDLVNRGGITFLQEMRERTGRGAGDVARAYAIVKEIFGFERLWSAVDALDNKVAASVQAEMLLTGGRLMERATAWFLRGRSLDIRAQVDAFRPRIAELAEHIVETLPDAERNELARRVDALVARGVPAEVAFAAARLDFLPSSG